MEMGHMRQQPSGTRSTTKRSNRGHNPLDVLKMEAAADYSLTIPEQEPGNVETNFILMTTQLVEGWIASNQTVTFLRVSNQGNT